MRNDLAQAVRRGACAMVQALGAAEVLLVMPAPPVAGDNGEELGLRAPEFQRRALKPVAVLVNSQTAEVIVAAGVLETLFDLKDPGAVEAEMQSVSFVQVDDQRYLLRSTGVVVALGHPCLYRLLLQFPPTEVV
jgi:hypothetical protein